MPIPEWLNILSTALNRASMFGVLVPTVLGVWRWRSLSKSARILVWYFAFWSADAFVDMWSRKVLHTNIYLFHVTVLVETWLLGWAYYHALNQAWVKRWLPVAGVIFTLVCLADAFWWSGIHHLNIYARAVQVVLMITLVLLYFEQWLLQLRAINPWYDFMFLVSVAQAIYYAGSVTSYIMKNEKGIANRWMGVIIDGTYIIGLVLMTLALWREGRVLRENQKKYSAA
ncbi:hypothetical protein [Solirubrum puertoriconensis]|uniref:Uncharacterized protein n=1 Tax=Solirubrum puertoriconensis TaxID=1751427 RepID=A0A9X0HP37_SOLP1|nr:hypothetical protein [Solirubrum puertoriconensis]KUG09641.1 hypothetical protein ASU33_18285 [Solirubrum puertoriconensis]